MSSQDTSSNTGQSAAPTQTASSVTKEEAQANHKDLLDIWSSTTKTITLSELDRLTQGVHGGSEWHTAFIVADRIQKSEPEEVDAITRSERKAAKQLEQEEAEKMTRSPVRRARTWSGIRTGAGPSASGSALIITTLTEEREERSEQPNE